MCPVPCYQIHTKWLYQLLQILFDKTETFCLKTSILLVLDQVCIPAKNSVIPPHHLNNTSRHSCFHWLPSLWNAMPVFVLNMSFGTLKLKLKKYLWEHFLNYFDDNNNCTLHCLCSCSGWHQSRPCTIDLNHF